MEASFSNLSISARGGLSRFLVQTHPILDLQRQDSPLPRRRTCHRVRYEYLVINFDLSQGTGVINLKSAFNRSKSTHLISNLILLLMFASFFSVFSELYEFVFKYVAGYQFDSSGFDTWVDIMANLGGAFLGYSALWVGKYGRK